MKSSNRFSAITCFRMTFCMRLRKGRDVMLVIVLGHQVQCPKSNHGSMFEIYFNKFYMELSVSLEVLVHMTN